MFDRVIFFLRNRRPRATARAVAKQACGEVGKYLKASISHSAVFRYTLVPSFSELKGYRGKDEKVYWETKYGFVLYCDGIPIASIGFDKEEDHLFIRQVQGVRGSQEQMAPLRWERLLFRVVELYGRRLDLPEIRSIAAHNQFYFPHNGNGGGRDMARAQRMHMLYDVTPVRCGFKWSDPLNAFVLPLRV